MTRRQEMIQYDQGYKNGKASAQAEIDELKKKNKALSRIGREHGIPLKLLSPHDANLFDKGE